MMCAGILLAATIVAVALIVKSNGFIPVVANDVRLLLTLLVENRRQQNALAQVRLVPGSKELYTMPGANGNGIEVHSLSEGSGPVVVDAEALDREWWDAVWRFCHAAAAAGSFAGEVLEAQGVIANDDEGWKLLTDVMGGAGMLVKRERSRTRFASGWSVERVDRERYSFRLPHPNRMPPRVNWAREGQIRAD